LNAQIQLDSLYAVWLDSSQSDSLRSVAYEAYIHDGYIESDPDTALLMADELILFGIERNYDRAESFGYTIKGYGFYQKSDFSQALVNFKRALSAERKAGREKLNGALLNTIGVMHGTLGNQARALEFYERGLKASTEMDEKVNMEMCVSNIGELYLMQDNYPSALEYLERGLQLEKEMGDSIGYAMSLILIADVYRKQHKFKRALDYSQRALKINESFDSKEGIADCFYSIGDTYKEQKEYSLALPYFENGLALNKTRDSTEFTIKSLNKIGNIHLEQGDYSQALSYCNHSRVLARKSAMLSYLKDACECLYAAHRSLNNGTQALKYLEQIRAIEDSLSSQEMNSRLQQMEFENQTLEDSIAAAEKERLIELAHQIEVQKKNRARNIAIIGALFILLIAAGLFSRWRSVRRSKARLQLEKDRSENLLLNILPAEIAEELKNNGEAAARDFEMVSIIFTDFKGFTQASEKMSAADLVAEINTCFKAFDGIVGKFKVEKIKTIGDSYMSAGGLPVPSLSAAKNTVLAAIEMQTFVKTRKTERDAQNLPAFEMRVGIHTGAVVAGIVGVKKFQYDIWGDTVNTASRMESSGEVGQVNISKATYDLIKDDPEFSFVSRGTVNAKGKGEMEMWFVNFNETISQFKN
jgi:class 3 adenylate cyclase